MSDRYTTKIGASGAHLIVDRGVLRAMFSGAHAFQDSRDYIAKCLERDKPRFVVIETIGGTGWNVYDTSMSEVVAHFNRELRAVDYAKQLNKAEQSA